MQAWYLIHSKPRRERVALDNLERQGYRAYLPLARVYRRERGRVAARIEPLFPRYLFLRLSDRDEDWGPIRSTIGVSALVRFGATPARLPDAFVETLRAREGEDGVQDLPWRELAVGERVRIVDGALAGLEAVFQARTGAERVVVLLQVAERLVRVELGAGSVEPV
jgi:transcriptional antiterminator RfaH